MTDVKLIFPHGAFGASLNDGVLESFLRQLAVAASSDPRGEWAEKYGTCFENDTFLMHNYCWCEKDDCRWCSEDACGCPYPECEYFLDGDRVPDWSKANASILGPWGGRRMPRTRKENADFDARIAERDRRLKTVWAERIHTCEPAGLMTYRPRGDSWLPRQSAPHFWFKPTGFKVWWYKYIGRDMELHGELTGASFIAMEAACVESLGNRPNAASAADDQTPSPEVPR